MRLCPAPVAKAAKACLAAISHSGKATACLALEKPSPDMTSKRRPVVGCCVQLSVRRTCLRLRAASYMRYGVDTWRSPSQTQNPRLSRRPFHDVVRVEGVSRGPITHSHMPV